MNKKVLKYLIISDVLIFLISYFLCHDRPKTTSFSKKWWSWWDQGRYYQDAIAWAHFNTNSSEHWYLPGYPLMGAPFWFVYKVDPFLIPNIVCFVTSIIAIGIIAEYMFPKLPRAKELGVFSCSIVWAASHLGVMSWFIPWNTTLATTLFLWMAVIACKCQTKLPPSLGACYGILFILLAATRPTEAVWTAIPLNLFMVYNILHIKCSIKNKIEYFLYTNLSLVLSSLFIFILYYLCFGFNLSPYLMISKKFGFEIQSLPIQWICNVISSLPLHSATQAGLAWNFPWILPGISAIICTIFMKKMNVFSCIISLSILIHWVIYLSYRDLHPEGLWIYNNYHYFKWTQPFFVLFIINFTYNLRKSSIKEIFNYTSFLFLFIYFLTMWRVNFVPLPAEQQNAYFINASTITVPHGLDKYNSALSVSATGTFSSIYSDESWISSNYSFLQGKRKLNYNSDYKAWPTNHGLMIQTLRSIPSASATIRLNDRVIADSTVKPTIGFITPCFILPYFLQCK